MYIILWAALEDHCAPTLHDRKLIELIAANKPSGPTGIRSLAREVAASGLSGRSSRRMAKAAMLQAERVRLLTKAAMMERLALQMQKGSDLSTTLDQRARSCLMRLSQDLKQPPEVILAEVESLANLFVEHGLAEPADHGTETATPTIAWEESGCRALLSELSQMAMQMRFALPGQGGTKHALALAAARCHSMATEATYEALNLLEDMPGLLAVAVSRRETIAATIGRADLLLDGWKPIILLWQMAGNDLARSAVLPELSMLVPTVPTEAHGWPGDTIPKATIATSSEVTVDLAAIATGPLAGPNSSMGPAAFDMIARNERLLALGA